MRRNGPFVELPYEYPVPVQVLLIDGGPHHQPLSRSASKWDLLRVLPDYSEANQFCSMLEK
jgi:hypothetical protein